MRILVLFVLIAHCSVSFGQNVFDFEAYQKELQNQYVRDLIGNHDIPGAENMTVDAFFDRAALNFSEYQSKIFDKSKDAVDEICRHLLFEDKEKDIDKGEIGMIIFKGALSAVTGFLGPWGGVLGAVITTPLDIYAEIEKTDAENAKIRSVNEILLLWDKVKNEIIAHDDKSTSKEIYDFFLIEYRSVSEDAKQQQISGPVEDYLKLVYDLEQELEIPEQYEIRYEMLEEILSQLGARGRAALIVELDFTGCGNIDELDINDQICLPMFVGQGFKIDAPKDFYFKREFEAAFAKNGKSYDQLNVYKYYELQFKSKRQPMIIQPTGLLDANAYDKEGYRAMIGYQYSFDITQMRAVERIETKPKMNEGLTRDQTNSKGVKYGEIFDLILDNYFIYLESARRDELEPSYWDPPLSFNNERDDGMSYMSDEQLREIDSGSSDGPAKPSDSSSQPSDDPAKLSDSPSGPSSKSESANSKISSSRLMTKINKYDDLIQASALKYGVNANTIKAIIAAESGGDPKRRSVANYKGLMQSSRDDAHYDPKTSIEGGAEKFRDFRNIVVKEVKKRTDVDLASIDERELAKIVLAGYNAGPVTITKAIEYAHKSGDWNNWLYAENYKRALYFSGGYSIKYGVCKKLDSSSEPAVAKSQKLDLAGWRKRGTKGWREFEDPPSVSEIESAIGEFLICNVNAKYKNTGGYLKKFMRYHL